MGWLKANSFVCVVALAISSAALHLDGNQTGSFTLKGGMDKDTIWPNLQQGGWEMLGLIQLIQQTVMNSSRTHHPCPTADYDWLAVQIRLSQPQQLRMWLGNVQWYCWTWGYTSRANPIKNFLVHHPHLEHSPERAGHDDTGHALTSSWVFRFTAKLEQSLDRSDSIAFHWFSLLLSRNNHHRHLTHLRLKIQAAKIQRNIKFNFYKQQVFSVYFFCPNPSFSIHNTVRCFPYFLPSPRQFVPHGLCLRTIYFVSHLVLVLI